MTIVNFLQSIQAIALTDAPKSMTAWETKQRILTEQRRIDAEKYQRKLDRIRKKSHG